LEIPAENKIMEYFSKYFAGGIRKYCSVGTHLLWLAVTRPDLLR
jgi:hypothetical protein